MTTLCVFAKRKKFQCDDKIYNNLQIIKSILT